MTRLRWDTLVEDKFMKNTVDKTQRYLREFSLGISTQVVIQTFQVTL